MTTRRGSCSCGRLRVICKGEPRTVSLCHCLECQRRTGSSFGIAAFFNRHAVKIEGESALFARRSENGGNVTFHFCSACGSTVYWEPERLEGVVAIAVGAFADPSFPAPSQSVWEASIHHWLVLTPDMRRRQEN